MSHVIEVFTAGCSTCDEAVEMVKQTTSSCTDCEVFIRDLRSDAEAVQKAAHYEIPSVPTVVLDGHVLTTCNKDVSIDELRQDLLAAGIKPT
jgi:hypothetical protein